MTLTKKRVDELKTSCLTAVHKAMLEYTAPTVAELQERAVKAAQSVRGHNELAYVKISSSSNTGETEFTVIVDLTSAENDAFRIDYGVKVSGDGLKAVFIQFSDFDDKQ